LQCAPLTPNGWGHLISDPIQWPGACLLLQVFTKCVDGMPWKTTVKSNALPFNMASRARQLIDRRLSRILVRRANIHAPTMAAHESPRTTKLYDRTKDRLTQDEVERIRL
jgi:hypothetical protein